jgi:hypothetical protein
MTPKEKSKELVDKFSLVGLQQREEGIECALIAVDEIIEQWIYIDTYLADLKGQFNPNLKFWLEVKQEIEKL